MARRFHRRARTGSPAAATTTTTTIFYKNLHYIFWFKVILRKKNAHKV